MSHHTSIQGVAQDLDNELDNFDNNNRGKSALFKCSLSRTKKIISNMTGLPQVLCPMLMRLAFGLTVNKEANRHLNIYIFLLFELFVNGKTHHDVNT